MVLFSMIHLHTLKNLSGAVHKKKRLGCGSGSGKGKTCGRGQKGQYAHSGHKHKLGFEGGQMKLIRRVPKRGFNRPYKKRYAIIPVASLEQFESGSEITPLVLRNTGLVKAFEDIKILGGGQLSKNLVVKAHSFSQNARKQITDAGGTCEIIG